MPSRASTREKRGQTFCRSQPSFNLCTDIDQFRKQGNFEAFSQERHAGGAANTSGGGAGGAGAAANGDNALGAPGGYGGYRISLGWSLHQGDMVYGAFLNYNDLTGAAFAASPLISRRSDFSFGFAISWVLQRSD